jgi:hypothetical protein
MKKTNGDEGASSSSQPFTQQQQLAVQQNSYMQSRAESLQNAESTIHELSNTFTQLATMVYQQVQLAIRWTFLNQSLFCRSIVCFGIRVAYYGSQINTLDPITA